MNQRAHRPITLMDEADLAELLEISVRTLQKWRHEGGGPRYVKLGRMVRYDWEDVMDWLESRKLRSTSDTFSTGG